MRRLVSVLCAVLALAQLAAAKPPQKPVPKKWWTYPMPPVPKPDDPLRKSPGFEVPEHPETIVWKITAPKAQPNLTEVPVIGLTDTKRPLKLGNIPVGTEVKLDIFINLGKVHYYAIPWPVGSEFDPKKTVTQYAWVSGNFIAPAGFAQQASTR